MKGPGKVEPALLILFFLRSLLLSEKGYFLAWLILEVAPGSVPVLRKHPPHPRNVSHPTGPT